MDSLNTFTIGHIAGEVLIMGGLAIYLNKKIATLDERINELESVIRKQGEVLISLGNTIMKEEAKRKKHEKEYEKEKKRKCRSDKSCRIEEIKENTDYDNRDSLISESDKSEDNID